MTAESKQAVSIDLSTLSHLHRWSRAGLHAPHKPLLVLYSIGCTLRGEPRLIEFNNLEQPLGELIERFGEKRQRSHPEYPFWRLQRDGFWEVIDAEAFGSRRSNTDPPVSELRQKRARGGFIGSIDSALRGDIAGALDCAAGLAVRFFPRRETVVLDAVGVPR